LNSNRIYSIVLLIFQYPRRGKGTQRLCVISQSLWYIVISSCLFVLPVRRVRVIDCSPRVPAVLAIKIRGCQQPDNFVQFCPLPCCWRISPLPFFFTRTHCTELSVPMSVRNLKSIKHKHSYILSDATTIHCPWCHQQTGHSSLTNSSVCRHTFFFR
jgi:hypothetical protein